MYHGRSILTLSPQTVAAAAPGRCLCHCLLSLPLLPNSNSSHLTEFRMNRTF